MVMDRVGATLRVVICPGANKDFSRGDVANPGGLTQIMSRARAAIEIWSNLKQVRLGVAGPLGRCKEGRRSRKRARR
jgi:hypothetical protein